MVAAFFMPEFPYNARMLTPQQRDLAVWRIESESGSAEGSEDVGAWQSFKDAFSDFKLYLIVRHACQQMT